MGKGMASMLDNDRVVVLMLYSSLSSERELSLLSRPFTSDVRPEVGVA